MLWFYTPLASDFNYTVFNTVCKTKRLVGTNVYRVSQVVQRPPFYTPAAESVPKSLRIHQDAYHNSKTFSDHKTGTSVHLVMNNNGPHQFNNNVVITVFVAVFLYCTFKFYSAIRLSSRKCVIKSVFSVFLWILTGTTAKYKNDVTWHNTCEWWFSVIVSSVFMNWDLGPNTSVRSEVILCSLTATRWLSLRIPFVLASSM